jgi:hypothetical protein
MSPQGFGTAQGQEFGYPAFGQPGGFAGNSLAANPHLAGSPFLAGGAITSWAGNQGAQHLKAAQINVILGHLANQIAAQGAILSHLLNVTATPGFQNQGLYAAQSRPGLPGNIGANFGNQGVGSQGLGYGNPGLGWTLGQPPYGTPQVGYGSAVSPGFPHVMPSNPWVGNRPTLM